ncbi:MAG: ATP-binding protein, partial [Defluviitaleaceae bacterium]|nr:ATP-binding protein [Defluviitaleaceae bacterium]
RATGETIRDNAGRPVRITGAMLDITETKKLLIDLETESSMLQTMFNSVPDLIFCKDMNLKYTRCNESLLKYFNLKESDLIGSTDEEGLRITSESAMQYHVSDKAVIESNRIVTYEEYVPNFEGVVRLFETNKVPLMFNGKVTGIMGIARDITERKAMEEAAQAANQAKTAFLANMSHEIRTPMNAIIGMSNILCHEDLSQRQMGYVNDISVSAQSLLGIINDILDMSKIEAGKLELIPIDYNFDQFFDNIVSMFTLVASNKGLDFFSEKIGILPVFLYGDDIRLRQVLTNICGNAVKFTANGYVKLSAFASDGMLNFKIEDTGAGIKKDDVPNLFKAFEQADKSRNRNVVGTGLGLPISKSFVEMMGGKITVESEYGHGTAFTVTVPVVEGNAENIAEKKTAETYTEIYAPDASILITDDNEFNLKVASGLMGFMDIEADLADSGFKAIKMVQQKDYDIVFMDHMMPEMDGIETAQRIRQLGGKHEKLVIVALTANAVKGAKEMFIESGFDDFITKPIDSNELRELIVKHLPPEKIKTVNDTDTDTKLSRLLKQDELIRKAIITFVKENAATAEKIKAALGANDTKTAHRIAHTLKSSAGFLRKTELQEAALSLESSLQRDKPVFTEEQIHLIEKELAKAFDEFEPVMAEAESAKGEASQISAEEMASLLAEIRPLIEKGEFGATAYVERLQHITGLEELAEKLDDYDFENALIILDSLKFDN